MRPGDIIAFSGKALVSKLVKRATRSNISHIAIICHAVIADYGRITVEIMESVKEGQCRKTGRAVSGVTRNRLSTKISTYDGAIWWLPLSTETRARLNHPAAINFLMSVQGRPYDLPQAIQSAINTLDRLKIITYAAEDYSALFCSELAAAALKVGGVLSPTSNPSEMTPIDLIRLPIYHPNYYQLKGTQTPITL